MTELERGTDRLGRRAKRFLTPLQKYEIWLQLVRGDHHQRGGRPVRGGPLDDHAAAHGRQGRRGPGAGRVQARCRAGQARPGAGGGQGGGGRLGEALKELAVELVLVEGTGRWG
jgi:transposase